MESFDLHMSDADALMWNIEKDPLLRSTIVSVIRLDCDPDWDRFVERIERGAQLIPRLRQRVVTPILRIGPPHWSADPHFDLAYHVRRMRAPEPATFDVVLEAARCAAMAGFDRARPLWEFTLIEGLADGGAAVILKVHHSITDGVGGMRLAMMLFDLEREPADPGPTGEAQRLEVLDSFTVVRRALAHNRRRLFGIARRSLGQTAAAAAAFVRDPRGSVEQAAAIGASVARLLAPAMTPRSPIMGARSLSRSLGVLDVSLDDLKRSAKAVGGTLNDAFVAATLDGMRRYHAHFGSVCDDLRMTMPINVRGEEGGLGGNHFTPARFLVPLGVDDPAARIRAVGELVRQVRAEPAMPLTDALAGVFNQLPTAVSTAMFGALLKGADFVASNVPGVPFPVYLAGAELQRNYAFGPLSGTAANVTLISHCGTCCIGVNTDRAAVTDSAALLRCLDDGFAEILELGK